MQYGLRIRHELLLQVMSDTKTLEVRAGHVMVRRIKAGDTLRLSAGHVSCDVRVTAVRVYTSINEMLQREDHTHIVHGVSRKEVRRLAQQIYPPDKERRGIYVFAIERIGR